VINLNTIKHQTLNLEVVKSEEKLTKKENFLEREGVAQREDVKYKYN
jgi:hypothetical protein